MISWVFGREFSDGTLKDLLAVPVQRATILLAKFIVVATWSAILTLIIIAFGLLMGAVIQLPGASLQVIANGVGLLLITAVLVIAGVLPFALFASLGRGYLLPLSMTVALLMLTNVMVVIGWGEYFPWAVPALLSQGDRALTAVSYWTVVAVALAGIVATYTWWKYADQNK